MTATETDRPLRPRAGGTSEYKTMLSDRDYVLATCALTECASLGSGGSGVVAPGRRGDLARLGGRALLAGFLATLVNACVASQLL